MATKNEAPYLPTTYNVSERNIDALNGGIRDGLGAWPKRMSTYSHYDESGKRVAETICLPPEKCGVLKVYVEPVYEDLMREEFR